jgi:hypothetical protein
MVAPVAVSVAVKRSEVCRSLVGFLQLLVDPAPPGLGGNPDPYRRAVRGPRNGSGGGSDRPSPLATRGNPARLSPSATPTHPDPVPRCSPARCFARTASRDGCRLASRPLETRNPRSGHRKAAGMGIRWITRCRGSRAVAGPSSLQMRWSPLPLRHPCAYGQRV